MSAEGSVADGGLKEAVRAHWERQPCGTRDIQADDRRRFFAELERAHYRLEPYLYPFARFERAAGKQLLEVGVGGGTDFVNWVRNGPIATGVDLTDHAVSLTHERLALEGLAADVHQADAERLPFRDGSFDVVYSWGVLHHSPDTATAVREVHRVLRRGGLALVMIYHVPTWTGWILWGLYCVGRGRPWRSPRWAIHHHLESPGTKAYTIDEARELFSQLRDVRIRPQLTHGDLLLMRPVEKYQSLLHRLIWAGYPRWLIRRLGNRFGVSLRIEAVK